MARKAKESELILNTLHEAIKDKYVNIFLISFAKLIAEKEREACAKMFEKSPALLECAKNSFGGCLICGFTPELAMNAICARRQ